jgi:MFS superfamily sulfate permease-like transporter
MASGFPPISGVVTAIVGGVLVSWFGSSPLTIKGPAAGLIVLALGAVQDLGQGDLTVGYHRALAVGVVAAALQIVFAWSGAATLGIAMSPSVVHGMLAAIGVIIVSKQLHTVVGVVPEATTPLAQLAEVPHSLAHANPEILALGVGALVILFAWPLVRRGFARAIPAPLVVLGFAIPVGLWFDLPHAHSYEFWGHTHEVGPEFLLALPGSLIEAIAWPDFSVIGSATSIQYVLMFALVGTIESTLSVLAVDAMDPQHRSSNLDRDLLATGVGNLVSASIGGLPMISEIVRSRANIDAGAKSIRANFFHGLFLLVFVAALPSLLTSIPLAALGAMLVYTGLRLASPSEFAHARELGRDQFALFVVTLLTTLWTNLLAGVGVGLALKILLHLIRGASPREMIRPRVDAAQLGEDWVVRVRGSATFASLPSVRRAIVGAATDARRVVVDVSEAALVDHTFLSRVEAMGRELRATSLVWVGTDALHPVASHPLATRRRR